MNKVLPEKLESITETARQGFERLGLELLGVIPRENMLEQIDSRTNLRRHQRVLSCIRKIHDRNRVAQVRIGAMSSANVFPACQAKTRCSSCRAIVRMLFVSALKAFQRALVSVLRNCPVG